MHRMAASHAAALQFERSFRLAAEEELRVLKSLSGEGAMPWDRYRLEVIRTKRCHFAPNRKHKSAQARGRPWRP